MAALHGIGVDQLDELDEMDLGASSNAKVRRLEYRGVEELKEGASAQIGSTVLGLVKTLRWHGTMHGMLQT
jgi:hypothetical protein